MVNVVGSLIVAQTKKLPKNCQQFIRMCVIHHTDTQTVYARHYSDDYYRFTCTPYSNSKTLTWLDGGHSGIAFDGVGRVCTMNTNSFHRIHTLTGWWLRMESERRKWANINVYNGSSTASDTMSTRPWAVEKTIKRECASDCLQTNACNSRFVYLLLHSFLHSALPAPRETIDCSSLSIL